LESNNLDPNPAGQQNFGQLIVVLDARFESSLVSGHHQVQSKEHRNDKHGKQTRSSGKNLKLGGSVRGGFGRGQEQLYVGCTKIVLRSRTYDRSINALALPAAVHQQQDPQPAWHCHTCPAGKHHATPAAEPPQPTRLFI
jgi:hypothetical protein